MQQALRGDPRARFRKGRSDWVELEFRTEADAAQIAAFAAKAARANRKGRR
jgi:hypothetical protein